MDSETAAAAANSTSVSESKENGSDFLSGSQPPAAAVEDDFETASESEDPEEKNPAPMEKGGNPNTDEGSQGKEEEVSIGSLARGEKNGEVEDLGGESNQEKDEVLVGGSNFEEPDSAVEAEAEGGEEVEGKEGDFVQDEIKIENLQDDSKPAEVEEKDEGPDANEESKVIAESPLDEKEEEEEELETNVAADIVGSDQNIEEVMEDAMAVEIEVVAADAEKFEDVVVEPKAIEEEEDNAVAEEKQTDEPVDIVQLSAVADERDTDVDVADDVDSKPEEGEIGAVEAEENGAADSNQDLDEAADSKAVEKEETDVVATEDNAVTDSVVTSQGLDEAANSVERDIATAETDKNDEGEETVVLNPDQVLSDSEAQPSEAGRDVILAQDVEPVPALSDNSESKETETELLESSGAVGSETSREISVDNMLSGSITVEKVGSERDDSRVADDDDDDEKPSPNEAEEEEEEDGHISDQQPRVAILDSSEAAKRIIKEMEEGSSSASFESSRSYRHPLEGQIVSDSDEEVDTDEEGDEKELFDTAALAALLKAASGASSDGNISVTSQDGTRVFSVDRPAGLGSSAPALRPAPNRSVRPTLFSPSELAVTGEPENEMDEEERKLHQKVEDIRVKFLRLVSRLGHSPDDTVAAQVLYRLSLAEGLRRGRQMSRAFSIETAKKKAMQLEEEGVEDLEFSCNILVLGKSGVGKSATINSIFGESKSHTNAFQAATASVREISGVVDGVKIRVIDTPGLRPSVMDQATNRRILSSIQKYTKKCPPDIVLYVDRLDTQTRDFNDLPLLKSITSALGSSIWFNAIVALTHAASAPPEGPNGSPLSYEVFIAQRSHVVQHSIRQAAGDMRLMNPVALVENHPSCRRNRFGEMVLPNGLSWRPQMLLLCYSSKILSEANSLLKLQDPSPGKLFGFRFRSPPLPYLLSTLLQSRPHPKLPSDQGGDNADSDIELDDFSDADEEEEDEYDQLPPFKPLKKSQLAKLTKEQKRAYFDEYDYRVKLLQKKQFKEEVRRLKELKKRGKNTKDDSPYGDMGEDFDQDGAPAAVPVPLPDMVLPPSFDCDVPTYRYRFLEPTSQLLTRPVLDTHGWDHDCGYDGVSLEESLAIANRFPAAVAVQITKDKKDFSIHLDSSISAKHGENSSSLAGFDIQSVGKQLAYILRGESKFKNFKKNKTAAGVSVTFLGETVATGLKVEDQLMIGKRVGLVASTGAVRAQGDVAYGANLEARLREKDYPIGQALSTLGLSLMKWRGDLALGANMQSQVNVGRNSKVAVRVGLNNKLSGQITVRTSTSEQLQIALVGIIPVALTFFRSVWAGEDMAH